MSDLNDCQPNEDPVELFDMYVAHVGINATDPADAESIVDDFGRLMSLPKQEQPPSFFAGSLVEVMKQNGRGDKGHIGFHVNDIEAACAWFEDHGYEVNWDSRANYPDGSCRLVYFKEQIGGFAIHLTADK
ncbi:MULTISPECIES: VOC family protein [Atopobiaceae]|uniref:2-dehydro-3-deoxyphosphogluconate aldolase / (4S)-4-hydroxy-2-oxoglutarate aldolase n=1 Tax=Parafannyhessea umbonata TaxID=604330 RepID=A0A1H9QNG0_9ACTN|nr:MULTISPECIES: 2-dehydro-3-deoxyphosphogluconate aldolase [Atopobiaceae]SEH60341.1 2-dehydro-3-deoxyphosphogluconate aldolase / (4S)-4-hydroxy-2-oxoglutarate aldolase [Parafannyhessea umbonata]SER61745.1 2-dehydro-3-deoxyphosphogluconate aldolase / (4S)-4-hydroxy-2-oxoglutarate aldolase [Parafannyhessea umbonata]SJZ81418.1 2-dehydro-3-deoxyphosphogluconate aldolase / (4S)-4-hydroxy-2-oxoglutarate aldolase [Olsenella sp. KH1P3]